MSTKIEAAIERIRAIGDVQCQTQMYCWPGFDPMAADPAAFFKQQGIDFDGSLFINYPVRRTFNPIPEDEIIEAERSLGMTLPIDYKLLLQHLGTFHLPGKASICLEPPMSALGSTLGRWWFQEETPLVLAISNYHETSDGNCIGFIRQGSELSPAVYEFDHELVHSNDDFSHWTRKLSDSFAIFIIDYLDRQNL